MNKKLQDAENALLHLLEGSHQGLTMPEILDSLEPHGIAESEIRAAVWTLHAEGSVEFEGGKLVALEHA